MDANDPGSDSMISGYVYITRHKVAQGAAGGEGGRSQQNGVRAARGQPRSMPDAQWKRSMESTTLERYIARRALLDLATGGTFCPIPARCARRVPAHARSRLRAQPGSAAQGRTAPSSVVLVNRPVTATITAALFSLCSQRGGTCGGDLKAHVNLSLQCICSS